MDNTLRAATQFCQPQVACTQSLGNAMQCNKLTVQQTKSENACTAKYLSQFTPLLP